MAERKTEDVDIIYESKRELKPAINNEFKEFNEFLSV